MHHIYQLAEEGEEFSGDGRGQNFARPEMVGDERRDYTANPYPNRRQRRVYSVLSVTQRSDETVLNINKYIRCRNTRTEMYAGRVVSCPLGHDEYAPTGKTDRQTDAVTLRLPLDAVTVKMLDSGAKCYDGKV